MIIKTLEPKHFGNNLFSLDGLSKETMKKHLQLYIGYVNKYNEINNQLSFLSEHALIKANQIYSEIRTLKGELSFAWGGIINHELYFEILGTDKGTTSKTPNGVLLKQINTDFGSFEEYAKDLKGTALAARGWAWTGWNKREKRLFNYLGDSQNTYAYWEIKPILAIDVYEHAYFADFGINRSAYIDTLLRNVNWKKVEEFLYNENG